MATFLLDIGARPVDSGVSFRIWAPLVQTLEVEVVGTAGRVALPRDGEYFQGVVAAAVGDRYWYWLDGTLRRPDPAFPWRDDGWQGIALESCIFYELHIGTWTPEGTFDAAIGRLDDLKELGITALQLMPVAQFPGTRNWGYDGVFPYAPQESYGGCAGLKRFVDACHARGLAVFLDVVYNHLGPEGNYLHAFGPYFTDRYRTPWGDAVNFDGPYSDGVRHFFIANACHWLQEYHFDGLRLDAVHDIFDFSARHILAELAAAVHALEAAAGRPAYVIAESDQNDPRLVAGVGCGGYGLDAQWCDDFHHALRTLLTGERDGYYADFGSFSQLLKSFREGFVIAGDYSRYRQRRHGASSAAIPPGRFLVFAQNHDQVGNRPHGERLSAYLSYPQLKLAAASVLLSPYLPLLFMGEEYAVSTPFPYFISHGDEELIANVRRGRLEEFAAFSRKGSPLDPQAESTFMAAKVKPKERWREGHRSIYAFYCALIRLRKEHPALATLCREEMTIAAAGEGEVLAMTRRAAGEEILCLINYTPRQQVVPPELASGSLSLLLDSADVAWPGRRITVEVVRPETFLTLPPWGVCVFQKE